MPSRKPTPLEVAVRADPYRIHRLDPDDPAQVSIVTEDWDGQHPHGRNTRPTPPVGDKSLTDLIRNMEDSSHDDSGDYGQLQPSCAVLNKDGVAEIYFGFRRARAIQTRNVARREAGLPPIPLNVIITERILTEDELVARSLAENAFRLDPSPMQIAETVAAYQAKGMGIVEIGKRIGKGKSAVSVYSRFNLLPADARRALADRRIAYPDGERLSKILPSGSVEYLRANPDLLIKPHARISARLAQMLNKGIVKPEETEPAPAKKQRKIKSILKDLEGQVEKDGESKAGQRVAAVLKYINGGGFRALVKALR